jgi:hypothetical protein
MMRILAALTLLLLLLASGCSWGPWQANSSSQIYNVNPWAFGSGTESVFSPASTDDMRTRH